MNRRELHELLKQEKNWDAKYENVFSYVQNALDLEGRSIGVRQNVRKDVVRECSKLKERCKAANRKEKRFLSKNDQWLSEKVTFTVQDSSRESEGNMYLFFSCLMNEHGYEVYKNIMEY